LARRSRLVTADHQNKPDLASAIARRWYDAEGVDMITDLNNSSVALAVQQIAADKKKIDIVVRLVDAGADRLGVRALRLPVGL
jgi:branched-chain amino acid transport system substrate-binding protein